MAARLIPISASASFNRAQTLVGARLAAMRCSALLVKGAWEVVDKDPPGRQAGQGHRAGGGEWWRASLRRAEPQAGTACWRVIFRKACSTP